MQSSHCCSLCGPVHWLLHYRWKEEQTVSKSPERTVTKIRDLHEALTKGELLDTYWKSPSQLSLNSLTSIICSTNMSQINRENLWTSYWRGNRCSRETKPQLTDQTYFPTTVDVHNHVYKSQCVCHLSKLDQENLQLKVDQLRKDSPGSSFFFRPFKGWRRDGGTQESFEQNLLYVHQEPWQKDLSNRYGNTISLMDATYKATK